MLINLTSTRLPANLPVQFGSVTTFEPCNGRDIIQVPEENGCGRLTLFEGCVRIKLALSTLLGPIDVSLNTLSVSSSLHVLRSLGITSHTRPQIRITPIPGDEMA